MQIIIAENYGLFTVEVDGQTTGPLHSSHVAALRAAKEQADAAARQGHAGTVHQMKGAGPIKDLLWEFGPPHRR